MNRSKQRRKIRVRKRINNAECRLSISRSNRHLSAQLIDLKNGRVLFGATDKVIDDKKAKTVNKTEKANLFGRWFGSQIKSQKTGKIAFDRSGYQYHGRVEAFATGLREEKVNI